MGMILESRIRVDRGKPKGDEMEDKDSSQQRGRRPTKAQRKGAAIFGGWQCDDSYGPEQMETERLRSWKEDLRVFLQGNAVVDVAKNRKTCGSQSVDEEVMGF